MKYSERNVDMLHGRLVGKPFFFTLNIALSSMLQQLFNAADTFVIGLFGNADALAAAEPLLRLMQTPNDIMPSALAYLRVCIAGYPFLLLFDFGAAVLRARGDSRFPFFALVLSGAVNVLLNFLFASPGGGVADVAAATDIAAALSAALVLYRPARDPALRLSLKNPRIAWCAVGVIPKTGIPSVMQGAVFCFANLFAQRAVNRFGNGVIAGSTAPSVLSISRITLSSPSGRRRPPLRGRITWRDRRRGAEKFCGSVSCCPLCALCR